MCPTNFKSPISSIFCFASHTLVLHGGMLMVKWLYNGKGIHLKNEGNVKSEAFWKFFSGFIPPISFHLIC